MKSFNHFVPGIVLILFALGGAGCQTRKTVIPLNHGYEEVAHPNYTLIDEPPPPRVSFQYRGTNDTVTPIWPSLYGSKEVFHGNIAIFVGEKAYLAPERELHPRLFAVRTTELPLDITDEVLRLWSEATRRDFARSRERFTVVTPEEAGTRLRVRLEFWADSAVGRARDDWPLQSALLLEWSQVEDIMRTVKSKGREQKDLRWKTPYIGEAF